MEEKAMCKNCTEEEMIEEMAKVIDDRLIEANNYLGSMNKGTGYWIAQKLVEHYQPKLPEGSVVLTSEDMKKYAKDCVVGQETGLDIINALIAMSERYKEELKQARKETAEKWRYHITTTLLSLWKDCKITTETYNSWILFFNGLAKQFGVEIEE